MVTAMRLIKKIIRLFKNATPRYHLSLDGYFFDMKTKNIMYRFKIFGEPAFPKFTFDDIKRDKQILYDIDPTDLIKIITEEYIHSQKKSMLQISEILRGNKYKLSANDTEEILSGDEICDNILLIKNIKKMDLYKIAYNTGFIHGRQLAKEIKNNVTKNNIKNISDYK